MNETVIFDPLTERLEEVNENLRIIERKDGLTFGTDAYLLSAFVKAKPNGTAVDFGCGTGVIALLCAARNKFSKIYGVELQSMSADLARRNIILNSLDGKIRVINDDIRNMTVKDFGGEVDAVMMNPPYMKNGAGKTNDDDGLSTARREMNGDIYDFCASASRILKWGGTLSLVHLPERIPEIIDAMKKCLIEPKILVTVYPTLKSVPSLVLIEGKKGASPSLKMTRPLIIYGSDGKYTDDFQYIYDNFTFEHIKNKRTENERR